MGRPSLGPEEVQAVQRCMESGWLTSGPLVQAFEAAIADYMGGDIHVITTNSCSSALLIALRAWGIGPGDEVITSVNTFTATGNAIVQAGAKPVFVDIDAATLNLDPDQITGAITAGTKAIIPVHLAGLPCDVDAIAAIADRHGLLVIEDAAQALSAEQGGKRIGAGRSDAAAFSFAPTKPITTGEGGMIVMRDAGAAARARRMRNQGVDEDAHSREAVARSWQYDVVEAGFKANMTDISAAIGMVQLRRLPDLHLRREALAARYDRALSNLPLVLPQRAVKGARQSRHLYIVRLTDDAVLGRDAFIAAMAARGIQCGVHYTPLHKHSYWKNRQAFSPNAFPAAEAAFRQSVTLPLFASMTDQEADHVISAAQDILTQPSFAGAA